MEGENRIVELWLKQKGFSVISNINAGKNQIIDFIALKDRVIHVEVFVSIAENIDERRIEDKFNNAQIRKKISSMFGKAENLAVVNSSALNSSAFQELKVKYLLFENVLEDVLKTLDQALYPDNIVRVLQILKYVALNSKASPSIIEAISSKRVKAMILKQLMASSKNVFSKKSNLELIKDVFASSLLFSPIELARTLPELYSKRSINVFIKELFNNEKMKGFTEKKPHQKSLTVYFE